MIAAVLSAIVNLYLFGGLVLINPFGIIGYFTGSGAIPIMTLILSIILFVGMILSLLGIYGLFKHYHVRTALATFVFGLVASSLFLVGIILIFVFPPSFSMGYYLDLEWSGRIGVIGLILVSIQFILIGVTFIIARRSTGFEVGSLLAGVLFIFAGAFTFSLYISLQFGYFILLAAAIIGGLIFLMVTPPTLPTQAAQLPQTQTAQLPPTQMAQPPPKQ